MVFVIPDIVKGGNQPTSHRKVAIRACLDELYAAGVEKKDILLLFSNGLHPRATVPEMRTILGEKLFNEFYPSGQITSHDSEAYDYLVDLGYTARNYVIMNKYVFDADIAILIGHTQGNPYGGYSGGYKHCAAGISHWRSISAYHVPQVMHRQDFVPVSTNSEMLHKFDQQGMLMEEKMGKKFFCCDAVLDTKSRQIEINSGWAKEMQTISRKMADKRTYVHWAEKKYDISVTELPEALKRKRHKDSKPHEHKKDYGKDIAQRPEIAALRIEEGHWEGATLWWARRPVRRPLSSPCWRRKRKTTSPSRFPAGTRTPF